MVINLVLTVMLGLVAPNREAATEKYADNGSQCVAVDMSTYGLNIDTILVNVDAVDSFRSVMATLQERDLIKEIQSFHGSYNPRKIAGTNVKSTHTWCLSMDFNAGNAKWSEEFLQVWYDHGWVWGGNFKRKSDPMHFSAAPWEGAQVLRMAKCPETRIVNHTERPWGVRDDTVLSTAKGTCRRLYAPNVCLVELRRFDDYKYHAICGLGAEDE